MAEAPEHIRKTLEDFKQQLSVRMAEAARVLAVVNALEDQLGLPKTTLGGGGITWSQSLSEDLRVTDAGAGAAASPQNIRPDEYLGDAPLDAAKKYLRRIRRAAPLAEIAEAISKGGAAVKGADWKADLDNSLLRSTREVVKVNDETYGLVAFYSEEQLKGLRATRRQRPEPTRKRGRPRKSEKRKKQSRGDSGSSQQENEGRG